MNHIREGTMAVILLGGTLGSAATQSFPNKPRHTSKRDDSDAHSQRFRSNTTGVRESSGSGSERARRFGYDDGLSDGANDHRNGYSFRPTHYDNYKKADRGCLFVNKKQYRQIYRQNYEQGYRRGYYER